MRVRSVLVAFLVSASMAVVGCDDTKTANPKLKGPADTSLVPQAPIGPGGAPGGGGGAPKAAPKPD